MVLNNLLRTMRARLTKPALPEEEPSNLGSSPIKPALWNVSTLTSSIRRGHQQTTRKHMLHDPRSMSPAATSDSVNENGGRVRGKIVSFEVEIEQDAEAVNELFKVHAVLVRPASVVFARQLSRGHSTVPVPGQDRDVIQLFVRFLYSGKVKSNVSDAYHMFEGCGTLNFKLPDNSFAQLHTPDNEEKLLVRAYLCGYSCSCWTFCDAIIDSPICKIIDQKRTPILHDLIDLNTNCSSFYPLELLIAHLAVYTWSDDQLCGFALAHKSDRIDYIRFWADVGEYHATNKTGTYGLPKAPWRKNPCHYHVHASYPKMDYTCYVKRRQG